MAYLGPVVKVERIAGARSNRVGFKAVIIARRHAPNGVAHDQTHVVSRTLPTRELAIAFAQRQIDRLETHLADAAIARATQT